MSNKKKRIMRSFKIHEISAVDTPAQEGARMVIMKSATQDRNLSNPSLKQKENKMTEEEIQAMKAKLAKAEAFGALTDVEKDFHNKLSTDAEKEEFLAKSVDGRKEQISKAAEKDQVVYKSASGVEYRKSDDQRLVELAKQSDTNAAVAKAATDALEKAALEKRATEELGNLPGTLDSKVAMLKSIEGIADATARADALKTLKAGNDAIAAAFKTNGSTHAKNADATSAEAQLDEMAKKYADTHKMDIVKAYDTVIRTPEGTALYQQTLTVTN